jgi:hypothetical protein
MTQSRFLVRRLLGPACTLALRLVGLADWAIVLEGHTLEGERVRVRVRRSTGELVRETSVALGDAWRLPKGTGMLEDIVVFSRLSEELRIWATRDLNTVLYRGLGFYRARQIETQAVEHGQTGPRLVIDNAPKR